MSTSESIMFVSESNTTLHDFNGSARTLLTNDNNNIIQHIFTRLGHVLTVHFLQMKTDRNDSAVVEVYDGISGADRLLASVKVRNGTLPQSVTSTQHNLFVKFIAEPRTNTIVFVRVSSGYSKSSKNLRNILRNEN